MSPKASMCFWRQGVFEELKKKNQCYYMLETKEGKNPVAQH